MIVINGSNTFVLGSVVGNNGLTVVFKVGLHVVLRFVIGVAVLIVVGRIVILFFTIGIGVILVAIPTVVVSANIYTFSNIILQLVAFQSFRSKL